MEENQPTTPKQPEMPASQPVPGSSQKKIHNKPWFIVALSLGGLLLLLLPVAILMLYSGSGGGTADKFYTMIEKTAQKTKIRYAYTLTIPEKGEQNFSVDVKSLAEYDAAAGEYSTAYASDAILASVARCVKGKEYRTTREDSTPENFKEAEEILKGPFKVNDGRFTAGTCEFLKSRYQGNFTDGILAVGLKPDQAKNMADRLRADNPAKLTDNGTVTYKGKAARKISFEVGKTLTGSPYQSDEFFYAFRDGMSSKVGANVPLDDLAKHFDSVFQVPAVGLRGFYFIDKETNLPLYRYMETVADDGEGEAFASRMIIGEYSFPENLTMDETTQLPEISKQE